MNQIGMFHWGLPWHRQETVQENPNDQVFSVTHAVAAGFPGVPCDGSAEGTRHWWFVEWRKPAGFIRGGHCGQV